MSQREFTYNSYANHAMGMSPFQIMQRRNPHGVIELEEMLTRSKSADEKSFSNHMKEVNDKVKCQLEKSNATYKLRANTKR